MTEHSARTVELALAMAPVATVTPATTPTPRLGRGIRWSDLVAEMRQELVDRDLEEREAAA